MCGILAIFNYKGDYLEARSEGIKLSRRLKHRGPDKMSIYLK